MLQIGKFVRFSGNAPRAPSHSAKAEMARPTGIRAARIFYKKKTTPQGDCLSSRALSSSHKASWLYSKTGFYKRQAKKNKKNKQKIRMRFKNTPGPHPSSRAASLFFGSSPALAPRRTRGEYFFFFPLSYL